MFLPPAIDEESSKRLFQTVMTADHEVIADLSLPRVHRDGFGLSGEFRVVSAGDFIKGGSGWTVPALKDPAFGSVHIHPWGAYCGQLCHNGHPSANDCKAYFVSHFKDKTTIPNLHYVFAIEGVYILGVCNVSSRLDAYIRRNMFDLSEAIETYMSGWHNARSTMHATPESKVGAIDFCQKVASMYYSDLSDCKIATQEIPMNKEMYTYEHQPYSPPSCGDTMFEQPVFRIWFYPNVVELDGQIVSGFNMHNKINENNIEAMCSQTGSIMIHKGLPELMLSDNINLREFKEECEKLLKKHLLYEFLDVRVKSTRNFLARSLLDEMYEFTLAGLRGSTSSSLHNMAKKMNLPKFLFSDYAWNSRIGKMQKVEFQERHSVQDKPGFDVYCVNENDAKTFASAGTEMIRMAKVLIESQIPDWMKQELINIFLDCNFSVHELHFGEEMHVLRLNEDFTYDYKPNVEVLAMAKPRATSVEFGCDLMIEPKKQKCTNTASFRCMCFSMQSLDKESKVNVLVHEMTHVVLNDCVWKQDNHGKKFNALFKQLLSIIALNS
jgi:hypothetical protein